VGRPEGPEQFATIDSLLMEIVALFNVMKGLPIGGSEKKKRIPTIVSLYSQIHFRYK